MRDKMYAAPGFQDLQACYEECGSDSSCWGECCQNYAQACDAFSVYWDCICGYTNAACKSSCTDACGGGAMTLTCQQCLASSPCATELYDYEWAPDADDYWSCWQNCSSSTCRQNCCNQYPVACDERQETVACACE